jgi:hypothetical protein
MFWTIFFALCNAFMENDLRRHFLGNLLTISAKTSPTMNNSTASLPPQWRCFENITCGAEAASAAASCAFSLGTLQIASSPDSASFAVTERKQPEIWRWAVIGEGGFLLEEGFEATQEVAKRAAAEALVQCRAHLA